MNQLLITSRKRSVIERSLVSLTPTWKAAVVEPLKSVVYGSWNPDSRTWISFWGAANKSDNIQWLLECSLARLLRISVLSLSIIIGLHMNVHSCQAIGAHECDSQ